jgi:hypothetical protein
MTVMSNGSCAERWRQGRPWRGSRLAFALLACGQLAMAQDPATPAQEQASATEPTRGLYQVEIIVFRHLDQRGTTPEVPPPLAGAPSTSEPAGNLQPIPPAPWPALAPADLRLSGIAARLRQSSGYELLYHGGWAQPVENQRRALPAALPADANRAGVQGSITLYRERFAHALIDIRMIGPGPQPDAVGDPLSRMRQGRRLRGSAPQYFDHPRFGLILSARAVDAGQDIDESTKGDTQESMPEP